MHALVVVVLHIATKVLAELRDGGKRSAVNELGLERVKEGLHVRVLVGRAPARHALLHTAAGQSRTKGRPQKLAAPIAVKDQAGLGVAATERRIDQGAGEHRVSRRGEAPGQHAPRALIEDRREVPPAPGHGQIREVAHPDLIEPAGLCLSHPIGMLAKPSMRPGRAAIDAHDARPPAALPHEPFDAAVTQAIATSPKGPIDPGTAVRPPTALEDRTHRFEEHPVLPLVRAHWPLAPRVVPGPRDPEQATEPRHTERLPFLVNEREDVGVRAEANRMSFFSNACSSWSNACARCNA